MVTYLLEHGANPNLPSSGTTLCAASWAGNLQIVKLLVEAKADVSSNDKLIFYAFDQPEILRYLLLI